MVFILQTTIFYIVLYYKFIYDSESIYENKYYFQFLILILFYTEKGIQEKTIIQSKRKTLHIIQKTILLDINS